MVARAKAACEAIHHFDQKQTDALCASMAKAAAGAAYELARLAVEETGIGRVHYKVLKNLFGSEGTWASIKDEKTVGIISRNDQTGIVEVATASGVVAGIVPTTNPTSTTIFKALIAVKGRNSIVISPHPRSRRCIGATVEVLRRAIASAGGPPDLVVCLSNPTIESTGALMKHKDVALILATGGTGLVQAAYSSGRPAYGVGPGNVPCYIDRSADIPWAAQSIVTSQSFDNATLCCSEQGIVIDKPIEAQLLEELRKRGAHVCDERETELLGKYCNVRGHMNPDVVGLDPVRVAELAGFRVPRETSVLLAWQGGVGKDWPLSIEILAPVLSLHRVDGWQEGCEVSMQMLRADGLGHTLGIHAKDVRVLEAFFTEKPANRIIVNGPCSQGAVGYSTFLVPSFSLGCGPQAGNITSDNISARHLVNVKRAAFARRDWAEIEKRDHERAAQFTNQGMPRGSGLSGDPALGARPQGASASAQPSFAQSSASSAPVSNWQGNPPLFEKSGGSHASPSATARPKGPPMSFGASSPKLPGSSAPAPVQAARPVAPAPAPASSYSGSGGGGTKHSSPYVGSAFDAEEIRALMAHAGSGCPMGACKGCPHHEVTTSSCKA